MNIYKEIIQQTPEWYKLRHGKVGGSTLSKVMANMGKPIRENAIYKELLSARWEEYEYEDSFTSEAMERGNAFEPLACDEFARIHEVTLDQYGWIESSCGTYGLSPDRLFDNMEQAVECKCPNGNTHVGYILDPMSMIEEYVWQVVNYFLTVEKLRILHFISYRPENVVMPLLEQKVFRFTLVNISKKETYRISELVIMAKERLAELEKALSEDTASHKPIIIF